MRSSLRFLVWGSVCALLALACVMLFERLGASVDAEGVLQEPFALIPVAWLFFAAAMVFGVRYWRSRHR
jgi:hypothetical protein